MLRFLADENFNNQILRGAVRRLPEFDCVRAQDVGAEEPDPLVLDRADREDRILLTHDYRTMPKHTYARVGAGFRVAGVCVVPRSVSVGRAIEDLVLIAQCGTKEEWENQVKYLPL
jgi:Domain of unknown function (DUF5615)